MRTFVLLMLAVCVALPAQAQTIINGGSNLLTQSDADLLSTWLGNGDLTLTNIFSKNAGDSKTSLDFHSAVDGQGATFSIIEIPNFISTRRIIGGYNPQSWSSSPGYATTPTDPERNAFIFNLLDQVLYPQNLSSSPLQFAEFGVFQSFNHPSFGPTFGRGNDIYVDNTLEHGWLYGASYGDGTNALGYPYGDVYFLNYGQIEVFTVSHPQPVPEPSALLLILPSLLLLGSVRRFT